MKGRHERRARWRSKLRAGSNVNLISMMDILTVLLLFLLKSYVAGGEVRNHTVEAVRDRRADRTTGLVVGAEHEAVDGELRTAVEQLGEALRARLGGEAVVLLDRAPRGASGAPASPRH